VLGERTHNSDATQTETAARASASASASATREAPAVEQRVTRSKTRKAAEAAQSSETGIPYSESNEPGETTEIPVASGIKKRKIKYTKKRYNNVSNKRYNKVSSKRYNKVSSKRYNKVSSKRYNKVSRKNGNYNKQ
jgi:hypothetical protein